MSDRVYILLNIADGKSEQTGQTLRGMPGVVMADLLDSGYDAIVVIEAPDRQRLVEMTMETLAAVEYVTQDLRLLLRRDGSARVLEGSNVIS